MDNFDNSADSVDIGNDIDGCDNAGTDIGPVLGDAPLEVGALDISEGVSDDLLDDNKAVDAENILGTAADGDFEEAAEPATAELLQTEDETNNMELIDLEEGISYDLRDDEAEINETIEPSSADFLQSGDETFADADYEMNIEEARAELDQAYAVSDARAEVDQVHDDMSEQDEVVSSGEQTEVGVLFDDGTLPNDEGYTQGANELEIEDDCGLASVAGNLNRVTGSELSENDVVQFARENEIGEATGSTTQTEAVVLYDLLSEQTEDAGNLDVNYVQLSPENMNDINATLQSGGTLDASVDSNVLWGENSSFEEINHAIGVDEPCFDDNGNITGYLIRDTGSGKNYATVDELKDAGLFANEQILISTN